MGGLNLRPRVNVSPPFPRQRPPALSLQKRLALHHRDAGGAQAAHQRTVDEHAADDQELGRDMRIKRHRGEPEAGGVVQGLLHLEAFAAYGPWCWEEFPPSTGRVDER